MLLCLKIISKTQRAIKCLTCAKWFQAVNACMKSFDSNIGNTIDVYQMCLTNTLTFQRVDDLDFEFIVLNGNSVSEENMDRLKHQKFSTCKTNNIALSEHDVNNF